ncbi:uncharacterized protein [Paramormyrops kingsleyae]|uniref:uncharacterized protein isoform X2 n=1 Tax=Paramormyrops kingsleyae TaxID=1676925 RepID=UPI003B96E7B1
MEFLKFLPSFSSRKVLCAAGMVVAAAGTAYLIRRLWERAQPEEDHQHQESSDDFIADEDPEVIMDESQSRECQPAARGTTLRSTECHTRDMMVIKVTLVYWIRISGSEVYLWVMNTRETTELSTEGFPRFTVTVQEVTGVKLVAGKVQQYSSYCIVDATAKRTSINDRVKFNSYTQFSGMFLGPDGSLSTAKWDDAKTDIQPREDCEDHQHQESSDDFTADEDLEVIMDEIMDEEKGQLMTWDFSPLFFGPVTEVRSQSRECQPAARGTTLRSTECHTRDMMVIKVTLVYWIHISGSEVYLWVMNTRETTELSTEGFPRFTETVQGVTGVKLVAGKVQQYSSYCIVDATAKRTSINDRVHFNSCTRFTGMFLGPDGSLSTAKWDDAKTDIQPREDCEESARLNEAPSPVPPVEDACTSSAARKQLSGRRICSRLRQTLCRVVPKRLHRCHQ